MTELPPLPPPPVEEPALDSGERFALVMAGVEARLAVEDAEHAAEKRPAS